MNNVYTGELVRLGAIDADEFGKAFSKWGRDSEFVRYLNSGVARPISQKQEKEWFEKDLDEQSINQHLFSIRGLADDRLLGIIDLYIYNWPARDTFVGIGIGERDFWSKSYGTDAMKVILRYSFTELNLHRVTLSVFGYNPRAIRSYEKVGFRHEGCERKLLSKEGKRWDMLTMGILREEWMDMQSS